MRNDRLQEADRQLDLLITAYREKAPKLAEWAEKAIPEALTVFEFPEAHRRRIRTSNMVERLNKELKGRTAVAMEISDEWQTGRVYLTMEQ